MTKEIQKELCTHLAANKHDAICENVCLNWWEIDVASLTKSGMLHEFEVKISRSDFKCDKKNKSTKFIYYQNKGETQWGCPNYFWYVCPKGLIDISELEKWMGLIYYENGEFEYVRNAKRLHNKKRKNMEKDLRRMLRLTMQRKYLGGSYMTFINKSKMELMQLSAESKMEGRGE